MKITQLVLVMALAALPTFGATMDDWTAKFYKGLEAAGEMTVEPTGFRGHEPAILLKWTDGMPKFGAAKSFASTCAGVQDWTVSAQVCCATGGVASVAIEFFDARGASLGVKNGVPRVHTDWTPVSWKFVSPRAAVKAEVQLLSLERSPVRFARMAVASVKGIDKNEVPFAMKVLPAEWNRDWNGGVTRMLNFSDAPIPLTVLLSGNRRELKRPVFEVDLPEELEIKDAYCAFVKAYGRETPTSITPVEGNGRRFTRFRFASLRYLKFMKTAQFATDGAGGISLVIGPKSSAAQGSPTAQGARTSRFAERMLVVDG